MAEPLSTIRFPGESPEYPAARDTQLLAEMALRRQTEGVAALRRALPAGGIVPEDYVFQESAGGDATASKPVRLSELFADGENTLILYNYMFGPATREFTMASLEPSGRYRREGRGEKWTPRLSY